MIVTSNEYKTLNNPNVNGCKISHLLLNTMGNRNDSMKSYSLLRLRSPNKYIGTQSIKSFFFFKITKTASKRVTKKH